MNAPVHFDPVSDAYTPAARRRSMSAIRKLYQNDV